MQEAPFEGSRSGSEEDILEYDEPVISCDICKRKRKCTLGEKILLGVAVVSVIIIIALSVAVSNSKKEKNRKPETCDINELFCLLQTNLSGPNTFGTMKRCSRQG